MVLLNHSNNITRNEDVFVGYSEISVNVIVNLAFLSAWGNLFIFSVLWGEKKLLNCGLFLFCFLGGEGAISTQADTMICKCS